VRRTRGNYLYSENREVISRIYQLSRRFEPVAMIAELGEGPPA
jgi:hypothetical protein